jgi:hypothetical protein
MPGGGFLSPLAGTLAWSIQSPPERLNPQAKEARMKTWIRWMIILAIVVLLHFL